MRSMLADLFTDIATHAAAFAEPVLAQLCRMAAIEAETTDVRWSSKTKPNTVAIWDWDLPNNLNRLDPNGAHMFGVLPSKAGKGLPNSIYLEAVYPGDLEVVVSSMDQSLKGGAWERNTESSPRAKRDGYLQRDFAFSINQIALSGSLVLSRQKIDAGRAARAKAAAGLRQRRLFSRISRSRCPNA